ncbi:MAG TPA: hypothetical protein PLV61_11165 [Parvularculaceae bacterium]|nr:hypothetical protein [Parvularculaceae bacterium]HRX40613.1 hypothetical protein [Parvularculaceae bacterium]
MAFLERLKLRRSAALGDEASALAPIPRAPKLKARLTELSQLFFPTKTARRLAPSGPLAEAPPDPSKILFPASASDGDHGRASQYESVEDSLMQDVESLDSVDTANAGIVGRSLASALLDRAIGMAIANIAFFVQVALAIGFVAFFTGLFYRVATDTPFGIYGFGTLYFLTGALTAAFVVFFAEGASRGALVRCLKAENNLTAIVAQTTNDFHDRLVRLRSKMEANAASDLPEAIAAASEARLTTVAALRFFKDAPVIDAASGEESDVLTGFLRETAGSELKSMTRSLLGLVMLLAAFGAGAATIYFNAAEPPQLGRLRALFADLAALEAAQPGRVILLFSVAAVAIAPIFIGPVLALASAASSPRSFLSSAPTRAFVNGLHAKALAAAAERKGELVERYADALLGLRRRSQGWAKPGAASHDSRDASDVPYWRRAPEGPRFVETGFQATPKTFRADPSPSSGRRSKKIF